MKFNSTGAVIDAFGGNKKFAVVARATPQAVNNWRKNKTFPANVYVLLQTEADIAGMVIPDSLFAMRLSRRRKR
jgi:hypothetical protein